MSEPLHARALQAVYWQKYAEMELDEPDPSRAKVVFSRCLLNCPLVKLWSLYLRFIKKVDLPVQVQSALLLTLISTHLHTSLPALSAFESNIIALHRMLRLHDECIFSTQHHLT